MGKAFPKAFFNEPRTTMAKGLNKVMLIGHLGNDPESRTTTSGQSVANFTLATNENFKDSSGNVQERTEWHRIVVWGKLAEICAQYLKKGRAGSGGRGVVGVGFGVLLPGDDGEVGGEWMGEWVAVFERSTGGAWTYSSGPCVISPGQG